LLTLVYMAFAGLGCLYVVLAAFMGHGADAGGHTGGHGGALAHAGHHASDAGAAHGAGHAGHLGHAAHAGHGGRGHGDRAADSGHGQAADDGGGGGYGAVHTAVPAAESFRFPLFSPLALATMVTAIGGWGLIAKAALHAGDGASLVLALPAAVLTAYGVTWVGWRLVSGSRASSVIYLEALTGEVAEVTVPIPAGGVGEALAVTDGQRYAAPAREVHGSAVARGETVTIVEAAGPVLAVRAGWSPHPPAAALEPPPPQTSRAPEPTKTR